MRPEAGQSVTLVERSQCEYSAQTGLTPTLAAVLGAASDDGFGRAFRNAATDGKAARAESDIAHSVFVVGEVDEMLPELLSLRAGQLGIVGFQLAFDAVDGRVLRVETFVPVAELARAAFDAYAQP